MIGFRKIILLFVLFLNLSASVHAAGAHDFMCGLISGYNPKAEHLKWIPESVKARAGLLGVKRSKFGTTVYFPPQANPMPGFEEIPKSAKAIVLFFGGAGIPSGSGQTSTYLGYALNRYQVGYVGLDYPYHANGPHSSDYNNWPVVEKMFFEFVKHYKKTGLPVFLVGHSAGPLFIQELVMKSNRLVDGVVLASGAGLTDELNQHYKDVVSTYVDENDLMFGTKENLWFEGPDSKSGILGQMRSTSVQSFETPIPALFISGDRDPLSPVDLVYDAASRYRNSQVLIYPDAGHIDVLKVNGDKERRFVEDVLAFVTKTTKQKLLPEPGSIPAKAQLQYWFERSGLFRLWLEILGLKIERVLANEKWADSVWSSWSKDKFRFAIEIIRRNESYLTVAQVQKFKAWEMEQKNSIKPNESSAAESLLMSLGL